jgi:Holliday junction resolvase-like predicted endonuclease
MGKALEAMLWFNGTPTGSPLTATQWQDPISSGLINALVAIDEFMNPPGGPGFWEGMIPVWGPGKTAGAHLANGNYLAAAVFAAIGALDVASLGALGSVLRSVGRAGTEAAVSAGARTAAMALGDAGEQAAVEMLARSGFRDILPITNASGNGLDIVARAADGHFLVMEVKASATADALAVRSLPRSQANMDAMLARMLDDAADGVGRYASIDAAQQAQAQALRAAYRTSPGNVSGAVAGFDASTGNMFVQRWARNGG